MNNIWQTVSLGDTATVSAGNSAPQNKSLFTNGTFPFIRTADVGRVRFGSLDSSVDYLNAEGIKKLRRFRKGTILLPKSGASTFLNHRVIMDIDGYVASHLATIEAHDSMAVPRFLLYYLSTVRAQDLIQDHKYPSLNLPVIKAIQVSLPSLSEQKRIVAILDEAFAGIATAIANTEKNLANARELFESHLDAVFTQKGEGWEEKRLGEVYDVRDGTHDSPKYQPEGRALITSKNLKRGGLTFDRLNYISEEDYLAICKRSFVEKGDVLFAMIGTIGNPVVIEVNPDFAIKNVALFKVGNGQNGHFLKYYLSTSFVMKKMESEAKGTTQKFVGLGYLRDFPIAVPRLSEQIDLVQKIDSYATKTQHLESIYHRKLDSLAELKQSILQKVFTGELTANPDKALKEARL